MERKKNLVIDINDYIKAKKVPNEIINLGFFGSCYTSDIPADYDIILFVENLKVNNYNQTILELTKSIRNDLDTNINILSNSTKNIEEYFYRMSIELNIPIRYGLGPAKNPPKESYIHINGLFDNNLWHLFCSSLPIHAAIIAKNYFPIIGPKLDIPKLKKSDFLDYIKLMDSRFMNTQITHSYLRKIVKALTLSKGLNSANYSECLAFLDSNNYIPNELFNQLNNIHIIKENYNLMKIYEHLKPLFYEK